MDKKGLQKIIKEFFTPFATQHKLIFHKPSLMVRIKNDTIHIICFELTKEGFYCSISVQPLYIPSENISLSFGNRINHFKTKLPGIWGYGNSKQEIEKDLLQVKELLETNVLKWFDDVGSPEGIVSFIESGLSEDTNIIVGFPPALRNLYLGFSYLYNNKAELALKPLQTFIEIYKDDNRDWVIQKKDMVNNIISIIKNEPGIINEILEEYTTQTKSNLKLKI